MRLDWKTGMGCLAMLGSAWMLYTFWHDDSTGHLVWNGSGWRLERTTASIVVDDLKLSVVADLQQLLLLTLDENSGNRFWLCAERGAFPERWLDFRRAVYSTSRLSNRQAAVDHVPS